MFFIDGDMEIIPEALSLVYNEKSGLYFPFISGNFQNYFYDNNWNFLNKDNGLYSSEADFYTFTTGGLFLIETELWHKFNGMDHRFKKSQDIDFAFRLAKQGYMLLRKKEIIAIHHMIPYLDKDRKWKSFLDNLYSRSFLYRNNLLNKYAWKRILRNDTSVCIMIFSYYNLLFFSYLYIFFMFLLNHYEKEKLFF